MVRLSIVPREKAFFALFEQSAQNAVRAAQQLRDMVHIWENVRERVAVIADLERQGDAITHQTIARSHRTFVTPLDHEDIVSLANALDEVTDFIHSSADAMLVYKVERPTDRTKELANIIVQITAEIEKAVSEMRQHIDRKQLIQHCIEINRLENLGDSIHRAAKAELFAGSADYADLIKWREIYENMESVIDRCEDVSDIVEGVALKYT